MGILAVITNPNAMQNNKQPDRYIKLKAIMGDSGIVRQTPVPTDIQAAADELVDHHEIDVLGICGGDGTLQHTLTAFINAYGGTLPPLICPLRGGTMNTIARSVGTVGSAEQKLAEVVGKFRRGESFLHSDRNLMKITADDGVRYCFLFGNGLVANYLDVYYGSPYEGTTAGAWVIQRGVVAALTRNRHFESIFGRVNLRVSIDGQDVPFNDYLGVLSATVCDVGLGFKPLYRAEERSGAFHILASGLSAGDLVKNLPRFFRGVRLKGNEHYDTLAHEATIEADQPFRFMTDGELATTSRAHISLGPPARVLVR